MPARSRPPAPSKAVLNARRLAAERGIFKIEEIHRLLKPYGVTITSSQLGKVLRNRVDYIDLALLDALRRWLNVSFDDLLSSRAVESRAPSPAPAARPNPIDSTPPRASTPHDTPQNDQAIRPPDARPLPKRS